MTIAMEPAVEAPIEAGSVVIENASWELYERLLKETDGQHLRIFYDEGVLEIMSPRLDHEAPKKILGGFVELVAVELNIPMRRAGSTTWKRRKLRKGAEPDECYYIQHERQVRGKKEINLRRDPPPDLVIEVDITSSTIDKRRIYAARGVPELWSFANGKVVMLHLRRRKYEQRDASLAMPFVRAEHVQRFLNMLYDKEETTVLRAWRDWVVRRYLTKG